MTRFTQILKTVRNLAVVICFALLNGSKGYVIPVSTDPFELTVNVQVAPPGADVGVYARCGVDVGGAATNSPVFDTETSTVNGTANLFLAEPA